MDTVAVKQPFNAAQMLVLRSFASVKAEKDREELTSLYLDFLQKSWRRQPISGGKKMR